MNVQAQASPKRRKYYDVLVQGGRLVDEVCNPAEFLPLLCPADMNVQPTGHLDGEQSSSTKVKSRNQPEGSKNLPCDEMLIEELDERDSLISRPVDTSMGKVMQQNDKSCGLQEMGKLQGDDIVGIDGHRLPPVSPVAAHGKRADFEILTTEVRTAVENGPGNAGHLRYISPKRFTDVYERLESQTETTFVRKVDREKLGIPTFPDFNDLSKKNF